MAALVTSTQQMARCADLRLEVLAEPAAAKISPPSSPAARASKIQAAADPPCALQPHAPFQCARAIESEGQPSFPVSALGADGGNNTTLKHK